MDLAERFQHLVDTPGVAPAAFALAFLAGAAHAVGPGHGKSLAAAYLIGSRGRARDAVVMGGAVALMHTFSVLVLAVAWTFLSLSDVVGLHTLTTVLQLAAGLLVVATGLWLLRRWVADWRASSGSAHGHGHGHGHGHAEPSTSRPSMVLLGISGGLVPSPSAFLALATGLFLGRAGFALLLVVTFGIGMAVVLVGVGLLALAGNNAVIRGAESRAALAVATRVAPILAASGITVMGGVIATLAVTSL